MNQNEKALAALTKEQAQVAIYAMAGGRTVNSFAQGRPANETPQRTRKSALELVNRTAMALGIEPRGSKSLPEIAEKSVALLTGHTEKTPNEGVLEVVRALEWIRGDVLRMEGDDWDGFKKIEFAISALESQPVAEMVVESAPKIEFFFRHNGEIIDGNEARLFVFCDSVWQDNFESCESQSAVVDFDSFIRERKDLQWRAQQPQAPAVEVPSVDKLLEFFSGAEVMAPNGDSFVMGSTDAIEFSHAIHAILQSKVGAK